MDQKIVESIKEGFRVFLMAVIPLVIVELENGGTFDFRAIVIAGAIAVLRFLDKIVYLEQKETKTSAQLESGWKGITGF